MKVFRGASFYLSAVVASISLSVSAEEGLDTNREAVEFNFEEPRPGGKTYIDTLSVETVSTTNFFGVPATTNMKMTMTTELNATNRAEGGQLVYAVITGLKVHLESSMGSGLSSSSGMSLDCDSAVPIEDGVPFQCQPFYATVGSNVSFIVDDVGQVQVLDLSDTNLTAPSATLSTVSPQQTMEASARILRLLPTIPMAPGDSVNDVKEIDDDLGTYNGSVTLLGYKQYEGHDVAVFAMDGSLKLDLEKLMGTLDPEKEKAGFKRTLKEAHLNGTMYWDNLLKFARQTETTLSVKVEMVNPEMNTTTILPITENLITTTEIKG